MTFQEVLEEFKPYKNEYGMYPFSTNPPEVTQNDPLFTAYAMMSIVDACGELPMGFAGELILSYDMYINSTGLTLRSPKSTELDSDDNLTGWGVAAHYLDSAYAKSILNYARKNAWIWPSADKSKTLFQRWLGRFRQTEAHLMLPAGERPGLDLQFFWCLAVLSSALSWRTNADAYSLGYCLVRVALEDDHRVNKTPYLMILFCGIWALCQAIKKMNMSKNLSKNYGWANSPHAKYIKG